MITNVLAILYAVGFAITAVACEMENADHPPVDRIPPGGVFLLSLLWPIFWLANILGWLFKDANGR